MIYLTPLQLTPRYKSKTIRTDEGEKNVIRRTDKYSSVMFEDSDNREELHRFAKSIGVRKGFFHQGRYLISKNKFKLARKMGAQIAIVQDEESAEE